MDLTPKELLDKAKAEMDEAEAAAKEAYDKAVAEKDEFVENVKNFVDINVDPIADEVAGFMKKNGKKIVITSIIVVAVICAVALLNDILPKYLF